MNPSDSDVGRSLATQLEIMRAPQAWPERPYLRVERRLSDRPGQPICFLKADSTGQVEPLVQITPAWPPDEGAPGIALHYETLVELAKAGWRALLDPVPK